MMFVCLAIVTTPAYASLGAMADDIAAYAAEMHATEQVVHTPDYDIYKIATPHVTLYLYAADKGVFLVSWKGRIHPDLHKLAGVYHDDYTATLQNSRHSMIKNRRFNHISHGNFSVHKFGRMGALRGSVHASDLVPPHVDLKHLIIID